MVTLSTSTRVIAIEPLKHDTWVWPADSRKFAIIGDEGINTVVPDDFWDKIKQEMVVFFAKGEYVKGLCAGIEEVGLSLKEYFPYKDDDINEQPAEISYGI